MIGVLDRGREGILLAFSGCFDRWFRVFFIVFLYSFGVAGGYKSVFIKVGFRV